jgi:hypothetical protein
MLTPKSSKKLVLTPNSKTTVQFYICGTFVAALISIFFILPFTLTFKNDDAKFNKYIEGFDMNDKKIIINNVDSNTYKITNISNIISHHSYSYKEKVDNLMLNGFHNLMVGGVAREISKVQYVTLAEQIDYGVTSFDTRVSKIDGKLMVDHGIVYGSVADFVKDIENSNINNKEITIYFRPSGYSKETISWDEIEDEFQDKITKNNVKIKKVDFNVVNSDDYDEITDLLKNNDYKYTILAVYRGSSYISKRIAVIFLVCCSLCYF